jgi:membrane-bound serine protease (ClpP class)
MGILIELFHPGVALPGIIGGLALVAYFAGSFLSGNGSSVALLLLLAGLALIAAELILIPGSTIVGLLGIGSILASIYLQFGNQFPLVASLTVILSGVGLGLAFWLLPRSSVMNRVLALGTSLEGTTATGPQSDIQPGLVGRYGQAVSDLRPAGVANIEGERLDVVSDGEFVTAGTRLEVVRVEGRRVVVKAVRS